MVATLRETRGRRYVRDAEARLRSGRACVMARASDVGPVARVRVRCETVGGISSALRVLFVAVIALHVAGCARCGGGTSDTAAEPAPNASTADDESTTALEPFAGATFAPSGEGAPVDVVATVRGEVVLTRAELDAEIASLVERRERIEDAPEPDASWRNARRRRQVQASVHERLIKHHIETLGLSVTDEEVDEYIRGRIGQAYDNPRLFDRMLEAHGLSREAYIERQRIEMLEDQILLSRGTLDPTEEELEEFYDRNRARWVEDERVLVRTITIRLRRSPTDEDVDRASSEIAEIHGRIAAGESFDAVARERSQGTERDAGGELGWIVRGRRSELAESGVEEILFESEVGTLTEPLRTSMGFQIFLIEDRRPQGERGLDEVRDVIFEPLRRRNRDRLRLELVNELMSDADVVYLEANWGLEPEE